MIAAAAITPRSMPSGPIALEKPYGMNGCRLALLKAGSAMATNTPSAMIFSTTSTALSVALSLVPAINRPATRKVIATAGRLTMPPACGPAMSACGNPTPNHCRKPTK